MFIAGKKSPEPTIKQPKPPKSHPNSSQLGFTLTFGQFSVSQSGNLKWGVAKSKCCGHKGAM